MKREELEKEIARYNRLIESSDEELDAVVNQLKTALAASDRLRLKREMEQLETEREGYIKKRDLLVEKKHRLPPDLPIAPVDHQQEIKSICASNMAFLDFKEPFYGIFHTLHSAMMLHSLGAAPILVNECSHTRHDLFIQRVKGHYRVAGWSPKEMKIKFEDTVALTPNTFTQSFARRNVSQQSHPTLGFLIQRVAASFTDRTVLIVNMEVEGTLTPTFMRWFIAEFWQPLCQLIGTQTTECHLLWFIFAHQPKPTDDLADLYDNDHANGKAIRERYLTMQLGKWEAADVEVWLRGYFGKFEIPPDVWKQVAHHMVSKHQGNQLYISKLMAEMIHERVIKHRGLSSHTG